MGSLQKQVPYRSLLYRYEYSSPGARARELRAFLRHDDSLGSAMSRLRTFLQSLTTGEAGFMNACVGSTAFAFALYKHNREQREALEAEEEAQFNKEYDLTLDRINATKPEMLLDAIAWHSRVLESEAVSAGVEKPTRDELADEWLRRRLRPQDDVNLGVRGIPDAARCDEYRAQLKRMWTSVRRLHLKYPSHAYGRDEIVVDLNDGIARSTLLHLEPLDKALCRATEGCDWHRDCDPVYAFIRREWGISQAWPADDDRTAGNVCEPTSRVAAAMSRAAAKGTQRKAQRAAVANKAPDITVEAEGTVFSPLPSSDGDKCTTTRAKNEIQNRPRVPGGLPGNSDSLRDSNS